MTVSVPKEVLNLSEELKAPIEEIQYAAAHYVADAYRYYVVAVGAVDTGAFLYSIRTEDGPYGSGITQSKYVVSQINYAKVVELGWVDRGRGQASYPGRFPAKKAVESLLRGLQDGSLLEALTWRMGR